MINSKNHFWQKILKMRIFGGEFQFQSHSSNSVIFVAQNLLRSRQRIVGWHVTLSWEWWHQDTTPTCRNASSKRFFVGNDRSLISHLSATCWPLIGNNRSLVAYLHQRPASTENHVAKASFFVGCLCWQSVFAFSSWPIAADEWLRWPISDQSLPTMHSNNLGDCPRCAPISQLTHNKTQKGGRQDNHGAPSLWMPIVCSIIVSQPWNCFWLWMLCSVGICGWHSRLTHGLGCPEFRTSAGKVLCQPKSIQDLAQCPKDAFVDT